MSILQYTGTGNYIGPKFPSPFKPTAVYATAISVGLAQYILTEGVDWQYTEGECVQLTTINSSVNKVGVEYYLELRYDDLTPSEYNEFTQSGKYRVGEQVRVDFGNGFASDTCFIHDECSGAGSSLESNVYRIWVNWGLDTQYLIQGISGRFIYQIGSPSFIKCNAQ